MKIVIKRVECINKKGISKSSGTPYHIDVTNVVADVAFDDDINETDNRNISFGMKDLVYQVGEKPSSSHYQKLGLDKLKGLLPLECDVEMGQGFNAYGSTVVCILGITPIKPIQKGA